MNKKVAWALIASLVATPGGFGVHQVMGLNPNVYAANEVGDVVLYKGQTTEMLGLSLDSHRIEVSSDALLLDENDGIVTLQAQQVGTYTVYVYELDALLEEIQVTVKSHKSDADSNGDGFVDIVEIVEYLKLNPELDANYDGVFDNADVSTLLSWIDHKYVAKSNHEPEFIEGDNTERYWLALPHMDEPDPIPLHDFFVDMDGDHLFYQIHSVTPEGHVDFRIINNELHYITLDPEAHTHDIIEVTIRATDEHGAYRDGQFTIERNVPPQFLGDVGEVVDLGAHYYTIEQQQFLFTPVTLNLDDFFVDPNGDSLFYQYDYDINGGDFVKILVGENPSEMVIDLISGADMELTLEVTAEDPFGNTKLGTFTATFGSEP